MTKERQTNVSNKVTDTQRVNNNVNFIFPPQDEFPSDESPTGNSIKKDIKNIIETFGKNTNQDSIGLNSNDDTITYESSLHSEVQIINRNNSPKANTVKRKIDSPKQVTHKAKKQSEQDVQCSTCGQGDSTLTESSELLPLQQDFLVNENKHLPPLICKFCQLETCPASGLNRYKPIFHCSENRNGKTCYNSNQIERPLSQLSHIHPPKPQLFYSDPIYKQHEYFGPSDVKYFNHNWNKFRYHNSHEYLRPWNHQKGSKMQRKYSNLKQHPSGVIGNLVHNVGQWYSNLKHGGEGDREELCYHLYPERQLSAESMKLYKAKIEKAEDSDPERIIFNKVTGIPKYHVRPSHMHNTFCQYAKCCELNSHNNSCNKEIANGLPFMEPTPPFQGPVPDGIGGTYKPSLVQPERIDVYYFDHGNSGYYRTTDRPPPLYTELLVERTDEYATKFWAEIFGACHIMVAFITTFILQLFRFILYSMVRPLLVGFIQLTSDYFFKPLLTIAFNGFIQPIFILLYNIATSFRDLCEPIARAFGFFINEIAKVLKAIRLVDINTTTKNGPFCYPHQPA